MLLALIVRAKNLGASPSIIGVMLAFSGGGALLGSAFAPWVQRHVPSQVVVIRSLWVWAFAALALTALPSPFALGAVWGAAAVLGPVFNVTLGSYRYALVPDRLLARVQSAALVVAWGAVPLGQLTAGFLLQSLGAVDAIFALAGVMVVVAGAAAATESVRKAPRIDELVAAAPPGI
jgi:predicted MFS family arabinose efflux permease